MSIPAGHSRVVIVGGGTAGLEAARIAAEAGHSVVLFERQQRLGGSLLLASTVHADNERFLDWLLREVRRLGIDVRTGTAATVPVISNENPDAVIVATGAAVTTPDIPGIERAGVITGALLRQILSGQLRHGESWRLPRWQRTALERVMPVLQRWITPGRLRRVSRWWMPLGRNVVIIGSDLVAIELAQFLAERGRKVSVLEQASKITPEVGKKRRQEHMDSLDQLRVTLNTAVNIVRIERNAVIIDVKGRERSIAFDSVIVAGAAVAATRLADELATAGIDVQVIGDASGLGLIAKATSSAAEAVASLATANNCRAPAP